MARPFDEASLELQSEIFNALCRYADEHNAIPNPNSFYRNILKPSGYDLTFGKFRWHWTQLLLKGKVRIDYRTGAVSIIESEIVISSPDYAAAHD
jgi:hypothetical protein